MGAQTQRTLLWMPSSPLNPPRRSAAPVCLDGFWSQALQDSAQDMVEMKFAYKKTEANRHVQTIFLVATFVVFGVFWWFVHISQV